MMCRAFVYLLVSILMLTVVGSTSAELVGYWKLDGDAADSSGNGYDGTLQGTPTWGAGAIGNAMECDGDDWVDCGDILSLTDGLTLMCWVNPAEFSADRSFASRNAAYAFKAYDDHLRFTTPGILDYDGTDSVMEEGVWQHVAVSFVPDQSEGLIFYINGVETERLTTTGLNAGSSPFYIANNQWDAQFLVGSIDEVRVYDHILTAEEILVAMEGEGPELATEPNPEDETIDIPRDLVLSWTAGDYAATHDIYLGTSFDDVNDASRNNTLDVLISQGQTGAACDAGRLEFGQTYYWRVDEVNGAPDNTIFKGNVWSFTVEPFAYAITDVTVTSTGMSEEGAGPENTINGSGLNADDQHSTDSADMWLARAVDDTPLQIEYAFDAVYKLHEMLVWNYNVQFELLLGFGVQNATVEYSENGTDWSVLGDVDLNQATATETYAANTVIDFGGVAAQYVRLTVNNGYGQMGQYGLSEVRFLYVTVQAREPEPADEATNVSVETALNWRAGREADVHEVYLGTDAEALSLAGTVDVTTFAPGALDLGTTYYWQIIEVNEAEAIPAWAGSVWSFTAQEYLVVDGFESYEDDAEDLRIYNVWIDGWLNDTGSTVGHYEAPFAEQTIVHSGAQSMPLYYDNSSASVSEADFGLSANWTTSGIQSLSLFFYGDPDNTGQLYVKINGTKIAYDGAADDIAEPSWQPWNIDLAAAGVNLTTVSELTIGIEGSGADGIVYIDDIRLYPETPEYIVPVEPDTANLVAHYTFDGNMNDSVGSHNGTAMGGAQTATDSARGQVLSLDGNGDAVEVPYSAELNTEAFTVSLWANPDADGTSHRSPITSRDDTPQRGYIIYLEPGNTWQFWIGTGTGWNNAAGPAAEMDEWSHLTATYGDGQQKLYVNGRLVAQAESELSLNDAQPIRIGAGATETEAGNYFFQGLIDEVSLYNRALTDAEVAGLSGRTDLLHKAF